MKKILILFLLSLCVHIYAQGPYEGPDGGSYDNYCMAENDIGFAYAWWNDPDGDCISDDWIIHQWNNNGNDYNINSGEYGPHNFDEGEWDCCDDPFAGGGGGSGGGSWGPGGSGDWGDGSGGGLHGCACTWGADGGNITIDCTMCYEN